MLLGARQFFERRGAPTPPLPYDYAVEYIETDGVASYIDTGITPLISASEVETKVEAKFQVISVAFPSLPNAQGNSIFGAAQAESTLRIRMMLYARPGTGYFMTANPPMASEPYPTYDNNVHEVSYSRSLLIFDGVQHAMSRISTTCGVMCLGTRGAFPSSTNPQNYYTQTRFYYFKMYSGTDLVFDGIPVVSNGEAGLYDSISGTFKGNAAATGTITAGPRV